MVINSNEDVYRKHIIRLSEDADVVITIQQLLQIAVIPVLEGLLLTVISSLTNNDMFGFYEIARLFITGRFLELDNYCEYYNHMVTTQMNKLCQELIRKNTYRTKLDFCISTGRGASNVSICTVGKKCFCYDNFLKGELRAVSSSTYFCQLSRPSTFCGQWRQVEIDSPVKCGFSSAVILRGEELKDKIIRVKRNYSVLHDAPVTTSKIYISKAPSLYSIDLYRSCQLRILQIQ